MITNQTTITAGLNASPTETVATLNTFLAGVNPISIVSLDHTYTGRAGKKLNINLCYHDGGANYIALLFQSDNTDSSMTKANTFFTANPNLQAPYIQDISNPYLRNLLRDVSLVLAIPDFSIDIQANRYMAIVEPVAPVAAGATGTFRIIGSSGPLGSFIQATSRDTAIWNPGEYGWAATDPVDGAWQARSTCC